MTGGSSGKARWPAGTLGSKMEELKSRFLAAGIEDPSMDVEVILSQALGWDRARLHAHADDVFPTDVEAQVAEAASRRENREPLAYILEEREFWSLSFRVRPGCLIPRPETELLVERAAAFLREKGASRVLDVGTGSGAIAVALAKELPDVRVVAVDIDEGLLELAEENAQLNGIKERVNFQHSDLLDGLAGDDSFDAIISNPPYVSSGAIDSLMPEVSRYEPREALDGGPDGMRCLRKIVQTAPAHIQSGGILLMEMDPAQIPWCAAEMRLTRAFLEPAVRQDLAGRDRVVEAVKA